MEDIINNDHLSAKPLIPAYITGEQIRRIIRLPIYKGCVRVKRFDTKNPDSSSNPKPEYDEFPGNHQKIVSSELWVQANAALDREEVSPLRVRSRTLDKNTATKGVLRGIVLCAECNIGMTAVMTSGKGPGTKLHLYYRCVRVVKGASVHSCGTRHVSGMALERAVLLLIQSIDGNQATFARLGFNNFDKKRDDEITSLKSSLFEIDAEISRSRKGIMNLIDAIKNNLTGSINDDLIRSADSAKKDTMILENRRIEIESRLHRLSARIPHISQLGEAFSKINAQLSLCSRESFNEIYSKIIRYVRVRRLDNFGVRSQLDPSYRTYRLQVEFKTSAIMNFGIIDIAQVAASLKWQNIELQATFKIKSNRIRQEITLLEHGYSAISENYADTLNANSHSSVETNQDTPIKKALRWKELSQAGNSMTTIAKQQGVSKGLVSQHIKLLTLPPLILDYLMDEKNLTIAESFSFRELLRLVLIDQTLAVKQFRDKIGSAN